MATTPFGNKHDTTSNVVTIHTLLDRSVRYQMPDYQRRQAWDTDLAREYLADVNDLDDDVKFIGQVIAQPADQFRSAHVATHNVADGQQRTIISTITIACACDLLAREGEKQRAQELAERYLTVTVGGRQEPTVTLTELDDYAYQQLIEDPTAAVDHNGLEDLTQTVREFLQDTFTDASEIEGFVQKFLHQQTVTYTLVGPDQDGYELFDDHNGKRVNTGPVDRIKTCIMATANARPGVDKDKIENAWYRAREALDHDNVSEQRFWRHWAMSNSLYPVPEKVTKGSLFEEISEIVTDRIPAGSSDLEAYMTETADAAELYRDIATESVSEFNTSVNQTVNYHLRRIDTIGANPAQLLILRALREQIDGSTLIGLLERLEKFTFPRRVTDKTVPDEVRAFITIAHNGFNSGTNLFDVVDDEFSDLRPSTVEFKREFSRANWAAGKKTKYVVSTLEGEHFDPSGDPFGGRYPAMDVDHIAPRKAFTTKKYAPWQKVLDVSEDEFELVKENIGNVTLFEETLNQKAGDNPFEDKRTLYANSDATMAQEVGKRTEWSADVIEERSERLAEIAATVWDV